MCKGLNRTTNSLVTHIDFHRSPTISFVCTLFYSYTICPNLHLHTLESWWPMTSLLSRLLFCSFYSIASYFFLHHRCFIHTDRPTSKVFLAFYIVLCTPPQSCNTTAPLESMYSFLCSLCLVFPRPRDSFELVWLSLFVWLTSFLEGLTRVTMHRPTARATTKAPSLCSCLVCVWCSICLKMKVAAIILEWITNNRECGWEHILEAKLVV